MFRKKDSSYKVPLVSEGTWCESELRVVPEDEQRVYFEEVPCDEILKRQMDLKAINLEVMLKHGVVLDPAVVGRTLNMTDSYDIEQLNNRRSVRLYEYVKENQDKILESLASERQKQVESIS